MKNYSIIRRGDIRKRRSGEVFAVELAYPGDSRAHTWQCSVFDGPDPVDLTGYKIVATYTNCNSQSVIAEGWSDGNTAYATLPREAYAVPGELVCILRATSGDDTITLDSVTIPIGTGPSDEYIDPGDVVPSLDKILDQSSRMDELMKESIQATSAANRWASARLYIDENAHLILEGVD